MPKRQIEICQKKRYIREGRQLKRIDKGKSADGESDDVDGSSVPA